jgi:pimeloyl-ACP methyl ester carboxylesterase
MHGDDSPTSPAAPRAETKRLGVLNMGPASRVSTSLGRTRTQRILLRLALYGGAIFIGLPFAFAYIMTRAYPGGVTASPPSGYEGVQLVSEGLKLRAWLARGEPDKAAFVVVHGLGDSLESYQEHARHLISRGHTVILPDLRGHGGSEGSITTLGGRESEDVRAAMRYLRENGLAENGIGLMGHSMGAVAVLLAAADQADIAVVIVEAPYDTYRNTIAHHAKILYGLPSWVPIIPMAIRFAEWRADFDADTIDAVDAARRIHAPLLAIVDGEDDRMPEPVVRRIVEAHPGPNQLWVAAGVGHVGAIFHPEWRKVVLGFLDEQGI